MTDDELQAYVTKQVDERIAAYQKALAEDASHKGFLAFAGSLPFGSADTPREEQVTRGMEYYQALRQDQQEVKAAIDKLEAKNARRGIP